MPARQTAPRWQAGLLLSRFRGPTLKIRRLANTDSLTGRPPPFFQWVYALTAVGVHQSDGAAPPRSISAAGKEQKSECPRPEKKEEDKEEEKRTKRRRTGMGRQAVTAAESQCRWWIMP